MGRLEGKVAVITGAGSGIGKSSALLFASEGARVICADVSGKEADVAATIGDAAHPVNADVSRTDDVIAMIAAATEAFGQLDVLFNNAGFGGRRAPLAELGEEVFDDVIAVNLKGVYLGMHHAIPVMLETGGGSIINTASAAGLVGFKGQSVYAAAKGGVIQLTKSAALDYAEDGIRINAICPGMTWTGLAHGGTEEPPPEGFTPPQPMKRWGMPDELAAAALFLASDESSFVTGTAIPVDGGYVAR